MDASGAASLFVLVVKHGNDSSLETRQYRRPREPWMSAFSTPMNLCRFRPIPVKSIDVRENTKAQIRILTVTQISRKPATGIPRPPSLYFVSAGNCRTLIDFTCTSEPSAQKTATGELIFE